MMNVDETASQRNGPNDLGLALLNRRLTAVNTDLNAQTRSTLASSIHSVLVITWIMLTGAESA